MKVKVSISEEQLENDYGRETPGVRAECSRCGHTTESFGTQERSINRCLVLMREECPNNEANFYVDADEA